MKKIIICLFLLAIFLLVGCPELSCEDKCYKTKCLNLPVTQDRQVVLKTCKQLCEDKCIEEGGTE